MTIPEHTAKAFDVDLAAVAKLVSDMADRVERQLLAAVEGLENLDVEKAELAIAADPAIDALQREIEDRTILTIARRQPMAIDLREVVGALRIANDLERIGDLSKNIGKRVLAIKDESERRSLLRGVGKMSKLAQTQFRDVIDAYLDRDVERGLGVWKGDEKLDAMTNSLLREFLTYMMEDPRNITICIHLIFCIKNLERIGDHATNIAEIVYFIVKGESLDDERPKGDTTDFVQANDGR